MPRLLHNNQNPKPRERMSTKDFVPPDVSGLSKREARLVKNRAAAFLSRQRKREEFELMEVYVFRFASYIIMNLISTFQPSYGARARKRPSPCPRPGRRFACAIRDRTTQGPSRSRRTTHAAAECSAAASRITSTRSQDRVG